MLLFLLFCLACKGHANQDTVNYLASNLKIEYNVIDNLQSSFNFVGELVLTNTGSTDVTDLDWSLFFCSASVFEPSSINPDGADLGNTNLTVFEINGCIHKIEPNPLFTGFTAGASLTVPFEAGGSQVQAAQTYPNWYFVASDAEPRVAVNTVGEDLSWVGEFNTPNQWKHGQMDTYNPYTGEDRFNLQNYTDSGGAPKLILPTPVEENLDAGDFVNIATGEWVVVYGQAETQPEAQYLADALNTIAVDDSFTPSSHFILLALGDVIDGGGESVTVSESYRMDVSVTEQIIRITSLGRDGSFRGVQTLLSLFETSPEIPGGFVVDYPRYPYRGMHLDVSRNFHGKESVMRMLDVMAMYKMNKFHFHLTDDEGWRIEIIGLPELTEVGSRRCHDPDEQICLMPQRGSAPGLVNDGTGYFSVSEYREILAYANTRHIQVIPELDMPGHGDAPIKSMLVRYNKYVETNLTAATEFLVSDLDDQSSYASVQGFRNNSINPCLDSTYRFVRQVVQQMKVLHEDIQPLTTFHFGGDEVPSGAWESSPACLPISNDRDVLKEYFVYNVAQIVSDEGLTLSGWEDGFMRRGDEPFNESSLATSENFAFAWNNMFDVGLGDRAYILANADYKTVLCPATHFYFDHPHEPSPYDRGEHWATRISSNYKVFGFMPDALFENMGVDFNGRPIDKNDICSFYGCTPLEPSKVQNIIGVQGHLWSEVTRTPEQLDYMIFPRMVTLAERAWHKASWEDISDETIREEERMLDFGEFANTLGYKELVRLDNRGVQFNINPPAARINALNQLEALPEFPGLPLAYSLDDGNTWIDYSEGQTMPTGTVLVVARSPDGSRSSRPTQLEVV